MHFPVDNLKKWFITSRRTLPWREDSTPYAVWISEVMLQQTQVSVVISYFEKWMEQFPTIQDLAIASEETVIKAWEGLGYYSRARNLHAAAKKITIEYGGQFPSDPSILATLPGLGPYTIGAIRSFAFRERAAAVDGNVIRVLSRYFAIQDPVDRPQTLKKISSKAEELLPNEEPWLITEALIELGALVCKKEPNCHTCPLMSNCLAYRDQLQKEIPKKQRRVLTTTLYRLVGVIECGETILLTKGEKGKVMRDLYEFPYIACEGEASDPKKVVQVFSELLQRELFYIEPLPKQTHGFTRYQAHLFPHRLIAKEAKRGEQWVARDKLCALPFSSGHRRILTTVIK